MKTKALVALLRERLGDAYETLQQLSVNFQHKEMDTETYYNIALDMLQHDVEVFLQLIDRLPDKELVDDVRRHHEQFGAHSSAQSEGHEVSTRSGRAGPFDSSQQHCEATVSALTVHSPTIVGEAEPNRPQAVHGGASVWARFGGQRAGHASLSRSRGALGVACGEELQPRPVLLGRPVAPKPTQGSAEGKPVSKFTFQKPSRESISARESPRASDERGRRSEKGGTGAQGLANGARSPPKGRKNNNRDPADQKVANSALPETPSVAIIGGGISGLTCAKRLSELGIRATVFDTGKHGVGGRMATRYLGVNGAAVFDHGCQYFTASDPSFEELVREWRDEGTVVPLAGSIGTLTAGGRFEEQDSSAAYVGVGGMRALCANIAAKRGAKNNRFEVFGDCWVSRMQLDKGKWRLWKNDKELGQWDMVVIAHNGKCANQLLVPSGAPEVARQMMRLKLNSIWSLLVKFETLLPVQFAGAFVGGNDVLSWAGRLAVPPPSPKGGPEASNTSECWSLFSTATYGKSNKVPQEAVPAAKSEQVTADMLKALQTATGIAKLPKATLTRTQLWGAALPLNTPNVPCIFDAQARVGMCGDWLLGSSVQAACLSGLGMADHIAAYCDKGGDATGMSVGLQAPMVRFQGADIGSFPSSKDAKQKVGGKEKAIPAVSR